MSDDKKKIIKNPMVSLIAGSVAGGIETFSVWPMEYIKTQLQLVQKTSKSSTSGATGGSVKPPPFTGIVSCAKYTYQTTGFLSFYRGMAPVLLGAIPKAGIRFGLYDYIVENFSKKADGTSTALRTLGAGMAAGGVEAALVVVPVETLKTRTIDANQGMFKAAVRIVKAEGPMGLYKGLIPTVGKQSSNQGLRFMAFEQYKLFVTGGDKKKKLSSIESFAGGMFAGCFSTLCNNPFDMLKTRMQGENAKRYSGFINCLSSVVKEEGFLALWNGVVPRLGRVVPGQGIIFMSYSFLEKQTEKFLASFGK